MAQVLKFDRAVDDRSAPQAERGDLEAGHRERSHESDDPWPEVSRGLWAHQLVPVNPANSPQRVLSEIALILGGAGFLVLLITIFFGVPSS